MINENLKNIQEKYSILRENKARNEATIEGIDNRKKDLIYSIKNDLKLNDESNLLSCSDLNNLEIENFPKIEDQEKKLEKIKKQRESMGSVNLRADEETEKYKNSLWIHIKG